MELQFTDVQSHTFLTEEECENFLMKMRWSNGFCCPAKENRLKINRLNSKLMIRSILPKDHERYLHNKNRSGFTFNKWIMTFVSVYLYPTFLKCFQLSA
ncbi:hypothetical protein QFZ77_003602 [Paenibacillus sp. V4I3]|uniref:transposase n=1 Tax=unclassified Paenibacillus TaxID=185978 RepID=UPI00277DB642|nr:hypothetical protein [Paenibacillus sp. V4I3]MDQ0889306.1 hypothetical protein [Paenibacillus sp. V4I9]